MTSLRGVTRTRDQSSVSLAGKDFQNSSQTKQKFSALVEDFNEKQAPNINQSERHLTQLNMPEVCLDNTIVRMW